MSSSDAMFEASYVYYQYVNEQIVKIVCPVVVDLGCGKSLISLVVGWFSTTGV